ncbi:MAG: hypothetical protein ACI8T1_003773 [Verrucomicrobiales bacterium]|jgi:hypothetical protein
MPISVPFDFHPTSASLRETNIYSYIPSRLIIRLIEQPISPVYISSEMRRSIP